MIMWSAVILRIFENGSTRSPGQGSTTGCSTGPGAGTGDAGRGTGAPGRVTVRAAPLSMKPSTSCFVTRPANPVPGIVAMSNWCSAAILRTSGVDFLRSRSSAVSGPSPPFPAGSDGGGRGRTGADGAGPAEGAPPVAAGGPRGAPGGGAAAAAGRGHPPAAVFVTPT